jgi:phage shock protein E
MKKILLILLLVLLLTGCEEANTTTITIKNISCEEEKELVEKGALLIDVREDYEYNETHLENAINIPYQSISNKITEYIKDKNQDIILYCKSGKRASIAADTLKEAGYTNIYNLGGISKCQ